MSVRPMPGPTAVNAMVFLGSFLAFAVEPMVGRLLLPYGGGSFHVWATALMFFQGMLFLGYLYCDLLAPRIGRWHLAVTALPLLVLPLHINVSATAHDPVAPLLWALVGTIALPFGVLATTSVIAQQWLSRSGTNPYRLYAVSNAGALVALVAYPLVIDPHVGLRAQTYVWSAAYLAYVVLVWLVQRQYAAPRATERSPMPAPQAQDGTGSPQRARWLAWWMLSAAPSALLMATTNLLVLDLGSFPLAWVVPLLLYLLTFVLVFGDRVRNPRLIRRFWPEIALVGVTLHAIPWSTTQGWQAAYHLVVLFVVSMAAHGGLYALRPRPEALSRFYLVVALGGWSGAAFAGLLAPMAFETLAEYPLSIAAVALTLAIVRRKALWPWLRAEPKVVLAGSLVLTVFVGGRLYRALDPDADTIYRNRDHYGVYRVTEHGAFQTRTLYSGTTVHGSQVMAPAFRGEPTSYYGRESPLGDVLSVARRPRNLGVVGLGVGTIAAFAEPGESVTFFELDPLVADIAETYFTYLDECAGVVRIVFGDARVQLQSDREAQPFTVLVVDAFQSDAIPTHLLTREAVAAYASRLSEGGLLVFHISSRFYDLRPVLHAVGKSLGLYGAYRTKDQALALFENASSYFVLSASEAGLEPLLARGWTASSGLPGPVAAPWTDDHVDVIGALRETALWRGR